MAPEGLNYISSWVDDKLATCYQVMETADRRLLDEWMRHWVDIVDFEVHPVMTSQEAAQRVAPKLGRNAVQQRVRRCLRKKHGLC